MNTDDGSFSFFRAKLCPVYVFVIGLFIQAGHQRVWFNDLALLFHYLFSVIQPSQCFRYHPFKEMHAVSHLVDYQSEIVAFVVQSTGHVFICQDLVSEDYVCVILSYAHACPQILLLISGPDDGWPYISSPDVSKARAAYDGISEDVIVIPGKIEARYASGADAYRAVSLWGCGYL